MKKIYIIIAVVVVALFAVLFLGNNQEEGSFVEAKRGDVSQEIFESGTIKRGDEINIGFREAGRVKSVFKEEGEEVERGEVIASQEKDELEISLREAEANLASTEASLEILLEGASEEEREIIRSAVRSAETSLRSARNNLENQENITDKMMESAYKEVPSLLGEVYLDAEETKELVEDLASEHFGGFVVSETVSGRRSRDVIRRSANEIKNYRDLAQKDSEHEEKDIALEETKKQLQTIVNEMDNMLDVAESDFYEDKFTDTQVESLRTYRRLNNTNLGKVDSAQKATSSARAEADSIISSAKAQVESAESSLDQVKRELASIEADPRDSGIRIREAAVEQARTRVEILEKRISDTQLETPIAGTISKILIREGEIISAGSSVATIIPDEDFYVEVDIYEGDMPKVNLGNSVSASFLAFEKKDFSGEVISINQTGKVVDGVVYYPVKIMLESYPKEARIEMTVDVTIKAIEKENVLLLPERSIQRREGKQFITVLENGEFVEREIETGIRGEGRVVEVISGVKEGEKILTE